MISKESIRHKFPELISSTVNLPSFLVHLFSKEILSNDELQLIQNKYINATEKDQLTRMWHILYIKWEYIDEASFMEILEQTENIGTKLIISETDIYDRRPIPRGFQFGIPTRNPFVVLRKYLVARIRNLLKNTSLPGRTQTETVVLTGLGGVGKTTMATLYAYEESDNGVNIFWFNANTAENLQMDLNELTNQLNLKNSRDFFQKLERTENHNYLLVFDDAQDSALIQELIPRMGGQVLVTSRSRNFANFPEIHIQPFDKYETRQIFQNILQKSLSGQYREVDELGNLLEHLPLALTHAGFYMKSLPSIGFKEYAEKYRQNKSKYLELNQVEGIDPVIITWTVTFDHIKSVCLEAIKFLSVLAHFEGRIPLDILNIYKFFLDNDDKIEEIEKILVNFSLMTVESKWIKIHSILKDVIKIQVQNDRAQFFYLVLEKMFEIKRLLTHSKYWSLGFMSVSSSFGLTALLGLIFKGPNRISDRNFDLYTLVFLSGSLIVMRKEWEIIEQMKGIQRDLLENKFEYPNPTLLRRQIFISIIRIFDEIRRIDNPLNGILWNGLEIHFLRTFRNLRFENEIDCN